MTEAIATVIQRGVTIHIYGVDGRQLGIVHAGANPRDGLVGYNGQCVSVRRGSHVYTYDASGRQLGCVYAGP